MTIKSIHFGGKFLNFENDYAINLKVDPNLLILVGPNGFGKTTILELIYQSLTCEDLSEDLKQKIPFAMITTSQGIIRYDNIKGLQREGIVSYPQVRYKKQENLGYTPTKYDIQCLIESPEIVDKVFHENEFSLVYNINGGDLFLKREKSNNTFPLSESPLSIQNLLMMFLFAKQTDKNDILLLDMPEEHIHISVLRDLLYNLCNFCKGQIIVATHSPTVCNIHNPLTGHVLDLNQLLNTKK